MKKILFFLIALCGFIYYSNNAIQISEYTIKSQKWPEKLNGYRIVHLSDLQSKSYGKNQSPLLNKVKKQNPDLIIFTGDLIDRRHYAKEPAITLMMGCEKIAPTVFVTGNHEIWHGSDASLKAELQELGILVLDNKSISISKNQTSFILTGIADRADFSSQQNYEDALRALVEQVPAEDSIASLTSDANINPDFSNAPPYRILMSHRPEQFPVYSHLNVDLTFSGHSHGGQIRLPFIGGLMAPHQGILPEYDGGLFEMGQSKMIVSRGLGNSVFPLRVFNRPEIPVITLYSN